MYTFKPGMGRNFRESEREGEGERERELDDLINNYISS